MDTVPLRLLENRLRECRANAERQLGSEGDPATAAHPLEQVWRRALRAQAREIDAALERLRNDRFGDCEQCGEPLSPHRLYALPWVRKCFGCQTSPNQAEPGLLRCGAVRSYWY